MSPNIPIQFQLLWESITLRIVKTQLKSTSLTMLIPFKNFPESKYKLILLVLL